MTSVALLWHFHQPNYSRPEDNVLPLPWVRLHCLKDYLDMLKHVQKFLELKVTFNFTPSLLLQIEAYQKGIFQDRQFILFRKNAEELTPQDRIDILRDFFLANWERMIEPNQRYFSLLLKRGKNIVEDELRQIAQGFDVQEMRDLQIWANLVWIDQLFRAPIADLYNKGKNFNEEDKDRITAIQSKIIASIIEEYKRAYESGQIELTISPLHHPILPLLIDNNCARASNPGLNLDFSFIHPEDAEAQINKGIKVFKHFFGKKPNGMWPSEGSVCTELIPLLRDKGIEWIASDEEILARSAKTIFTRHEHGIPYNPELLYRPWQIDKIKIIFRDHVLSDLIGFTYNRWDPQAAAQDLVSRIQHIAQVLPASDNFLIPLILDGENAWESYANDGSDFIEAFYENLINSKIPTTTISGFLAQSPTIGQLSGLFPGSWIGANFNIWIGHYEDQQAWKIVSHLRQNLINKNISDPEIWNRFYMLEGSDWYWWFGAEHFSAVAETFDELFRQTAIWIYKKIGVEAPSEVFTSIKRYSETLTTQPIDKMTPSIDGLVTHFYEWYNAGHADVKRMGGTMHRFAGLFSAIFCGFDEKNLYIRFDIENHDIHVYDYVLKFYQPNEWQMQLKECSEGEVCIKEIGELAIPISRLGVNNQGIVEFVISALKDNIEIDRAPLLRFTIRLRDVKLHNWMV